MRQVRRVGRLVAAVGVAALPLVAWSASAGADTSLVGYNASTLAIGAQFGFNVPGVVPLPNENLIEEDVPFARTNVGGGPVVDALAAPYFPGDIAADLGSLLETFGAPALPLNDPLLAESKFPTSPGYPAHKTFGVAPSAATPELPSIFSSVADSSTYGGDATGTVSDLSLSNLSALTSVTNSVTKALGAPSAAASVIDVGNTSANNSVVLGANTITATSTTQVGAITVAGLIDIAGLTSTASATSDGVTGTPTATLKLGLVTVDGQSAYIDDKGVHIATTTPSAVGITPQQLQHSVDATLAQDGISIRVLDPVLTTTGPSAKADAGGLVISLAHQIDVPFIPGEPTIPVPELGNVGLPGGLYTATTSITFGLAQANVAASGLSPSLGVLPNTASTTDTSSLGSDFGSTAPSTLGTTGFGTGSVQSLPASGPGSAAGSGNPVATRPVSGATAFPILGVPSPVGWTVAALLACILVAYPMLLLARWQFLAGRRA
jgi:hypothetical protein